jgi:hypothetical protein
VLFEILQPTLGHFLVSWEINDRKWSRTESRALIEFKYKVSETQFRSRNRERAVFETLAFSSTDILNFNYL